MAKRTFSIGGVHPADSKISRGCKLEYLPIPPTVYIALSQHIGAPAKPVVAVGDKVKVGQVLAEPYTFDKARVVMSEMTDSLVMDLVEKRLVTDQMVICVNYERVAPGYRGEEVMDWYGRTVPKPAHGSVNLGRRTSSTRIISRRRL